MPAIGIIKTGKPVRCDVTPPVTCKHFEAAWYSKLRATFDATNLMMPPPSLRAIVCGHILLHTHVHARAHTGA